MIKINYDVVGMIQTNCYLIEDEATGKRAVIDPGDHSDALIAEIDKRGGTLDYLLLTHGHYDHVIGAAELCDRYHPVVCAAEEEMELLRSGICNRSSVHNIRINAFNVDRLLHDGDVIELGESRITFILTPGQTAGSGCYLVDDCIFSGDTIFCESIGRTDFETSSPRDMVKSVARIKALDGDRAIYPGHGMFSTLDHERKYNPFMQ